jgi:hypothetical protein
MDAAGLPDLKDAMTAVIGGGVALAGLLLIFCGFLFAQAAQLDQNAATESRTYIEGFRATARLGMLPFSAALLLAALALIYWQVPSKYLAQLAIWGFIALSVATVGYGWWAIRRL